MYECWFRLFRGSWSLYVIRSEKLSEKTFQKIKAKNIGKEQAGQRPGRTTPTQQPIVDSSCSLHEVHFQLQCKHHQSPSSQHKVSLLWPYEFVPSIPRIIENHHQTVPINRTVDLNNTFAVTSQLDHGKLHEHRQEREEWPGWNCDRSGHLPFVVALWQDLTRNMMDT